MFKFDFEFVEKFANSYQIDLSHTLQDITKIISDISNQPKYAGFVCQDPQLRNFLFDPATLTLSFIDLSTNSVITKGVPKQSTLLQNFLGVTRRNDEHWNRSKDERSYFEFF